jgi:hypothetical protein
LAIKTWAWQLTHGKDEPLPGEKPYASEALLIDSVKGVLETGKKKAGRSPKVLVIGAVSFFACIHAYMPRTDSYRSLDDAVTALFSLQRMLVSLMKTSSSGIWQRLRKVRTFVGTC